MQVGITLSARASAQLNPDQIEMPSEEIVGDPANTVEMPAEDDVFAAQDGALAAAEAAERAADEALAARSEKMSKPYYRQGRWSVSRGYGSCTAISDQGALYDYDERLATVEITIGDKSIRSLREGEIRRLKSAFIERASRRAFDIQVKPYKATLYGSSTFLQSTFDAQILGPIAKYDIIAFWTDQRVLVRSFDLTGSAAMIANLRKCATEESALHPSDPFAR